MKLLNVALEERKPELPEINEEKMSYDWRYENNVLLGSKKLELEKQEFKYNKWRTNSSVSNYFDLIFVANEMNLNMHITDQMHYDYLFHSIKKHKRSYAKKDLRAKELEKAQKIEDANIKLISEYYKYNTAKSKTALRVLTPSQLEKIKKRLEKGGVK